MRFSSQESIRALEQARLREKEAVELYEKCLDDAVNEGVKVILRTLSAEEKKHFQIVSQLAAGAQADTIPDIQTKDTSNAKELLDIAFAHISMEGFSAEKASIDIILEQAQENEQESFNLYSSLADSSENTETAAVYRYLAGEENKHYIMVSNMLNFLGDPGRWLYEEENLIFRRG